MLDLDLQLVIKDGYIETDQAATYIIPKMSSIARVGDAYTLSFVFFFVCLLNCVVAVRI